MSNQTRLGLILILALCLPSQSIGLDKQGKTPLFQIDVNLVILKASVTDSSNRFVTGLKQENFKVYEDGVEQTISHFNHELAPVSMGLVMDISSSMRRSLKFGLTKDWFFQILEWENLLPGDEYFLIAFNNNINLVRSFSNKISALANDIFEQQTKGDTALFDAIYLAMDICKKEGKNDRKALLLITDGDDNKSRYSRREVLDYAVESEVQIYVLPVASFERSFFQDLVYLTGGRYFSGNDSINVNNYIDRIHKELRYQYILGYLPSNKKSEGEWREIKVEVDTPENFPDLYINTKSGYYAPVY